MHTKNLKLRFSTCSSAKQRKLVSRLDNQAVELFWENSILNVSPSTMVIFHKPSVRWSPPGGPSMFENPSTRPPQNKNLDQAFVSVHKMDNHRLNFDPFSTWTDGPPSSSVRPHEFSWNEAIYNLWRYPGSIAINPWSLSLSNIWAAIMISIHNLGKYYGTCFKTR